MLSRMSRSWKSASAALAVAALACISTSAAGGSASSRGASTSLAQTCGTIVIDRRAFLVEVTGGRPSCTTARFVLSHARFRERSGVGGWDCWQGTRAYAFTSLVDACNRWPDQVQAVPVKELPRIGKACRLFLGPGDAGVHGYTFRVHGISCQTGKEVLEICDTDGNACNAATSAWYCKQPKQRPALGFGERCASGALFTSIVWLD